MGSKISKLTRVAGVGARRYPSRLPEMPPSQTTTSAGPSSISTGVGPSVHPKAQISWEKDEAIRQDSQDPDFQSMLRAMGAVQQQQILDTTQRAPLNSQSSNSLHTLSRRQILDDQQTSQSSASETSKNRTWVDTSTILQIISLRDDKGLSAEQIEKEFRLAPGFLKRLGSKVAKP
ncbi:hypothetical protein Q9L58_006212 [Maublancomyces gigas]|uniref:Helix-turn-helix domain-containing protein n=1 Tax=Discina gigas TaxID=1032678 RepID=A0ABR3GFW2_9PEZI